MAVLSSSVSGNSTPDNVSTGDFTITVTGTHACGSAVQPFVLDDSLLSATPPLTAGRWVLLRANAITGYVGATVDASATGLTVYSVSKEPVNFAGTTNQCIVVTLV
jgi:hypothetical protein